MVFLKNKPTSLGSIVGDLMKFCVFPAERNEVDEDAAEVDEEEEMTEIRFIPEDAANLQEFYDVISDCNLLHDPPQSNSSGTCRILLVCICGQASFLRM